MEQYTVDQTVLPKGISRRFPKPVPSGPQTVPVELSGAEHAKANELACLLGMSAEATTGVLVGECLADSDAQVAVVDTRKKRSEYAPTDHKFGILSTRVCSGTLDENCQELVFARPAAEFIRSSEF